MTYTWKISDFFASDGLITQVKYHCTGVKPVIAPWLPQIFTPNI